MANRLLPPCLRRDATRLITLVLVALIMAVRASPDAFADPQPFDLAGPTLRVSVTHGGVTLPIAETPNLSPGDQLSIRADLPPSQSVRYLLVAAFLRGATNPPPESWFFRDETWTRKGREGMHVVVPADAEQVVLFLAPTTGGDFKTLMGAVRGRPGAFVRASQDLNQAALDRSRLDAFLAAVRRSDPADPDRLKTVSPLLARSLTIKLNTDCFQKAPELQAPCLQQGGDALVLNDGHSTSIVEALTSGAPADLALQLSASPVGGLGYASPYVAAAFDIARILESFRTAEYQYIPALATARDDRLSLVLNTPPSFHNPQSVLVTALPAVEPPQSPPLQPVDPKQVFCAERTDLLLPVDGAPLVYSTQYAHDLVLRVKGKDGKSFDLPVRADAERGGVIADTRGVQADDLGDAIGGSLHGQWGFEAFDGPAFHLQAARAGPWRLTPDDQQALIVGRDDTVRLDGRSAACVEHVALQPSSGVSRELDWKAVSPDQISVVVPLTEGQPGPLTLMVKQYGAAQADVIALQAFTQAAHVESFAFHAGDHSGVLNGSRLDEVAALSLDGVDFAPGAFTSSSGQDALTLDAAADGGAEALKTARTLTARVKLKDGRTLPVRIVVGAPRPQVALIGESVQAAASGSMPIQLTQPDELPQGAELTFSVQAERPMRFEGRETIEVATTDGSASTTLTLANGLTQEDAQVVLATLDTAKAFGGSAFGPLRFRLVQDGVAGDWGPLGVLVRLPTLRDLQCREGVGHSCELSGDNLFLLDAVSGEPNFDNSVKVAEGFPGHRINVPHPKTGHVIYVRLHDDPHVVNQAVLHPQATGKPPTP